MKIHFCAGCGISHPNCDMRRSPAGRPLEERLLPLDLRPQDYVCLRCYVGYEPYEPDGSLWWQHLERMKAA